MRRLQLFCIGLMISLMSFAQTSAEYYFKFTAVDGTTKDYYLNTIDKVEFGKTQFIVNGSDAFDYHNGSETAFLHIDLTRYDGVHQFNDEGFCTFADGGFQPAVLVTSTNWNELELTSDYVGYYAIKNAGQLYWAASVVNSGKMGNGKFVLMNDIDLAVTTVVNPEDATITYSPVWQPIGNEDHYFSGTFDGRNHAITNFHYKVRQNSSGFVGAAYGAIIKNFSIYGDITAEKYDGMPVSTDGAYNHAFCGVVGQIGNGFVKNIHSYIDFNIPEDITLKHIGGIVGSAGDTNYPWLKKLGMGNVTINGCSYSGTLTSVGSTDCIAGILGLAGPHKMVTIQNCLFDGTLDVTSKGKTWYVGGILGYTKRHITMNNNFYCGTINKNGSSGDTGMFVGKYDVSNGHDPYEGETLEATNNYYYNTTTLKVFGSTTDAASTAIFNNTSNFASVTLDEINDGTVFSKLNNGSWDKGTKEGFGDNYPMPHLLDHTHTFDANGFCTSCDWGYQPATEVTESNKSELGLGTSYVGYYAIKNGGQLYWWSQYVNSYDQESKAILISDIDMKGSAHSWPCIGTLANPFMGTFEGNGKTISNFHLNSNSATVGMFGVVHKATIKSFEISGTIISNFVFDSTKPNIGLIARIGNGETLGEFDIAKTLVQDVWSKLNITSSSKSGTSYNGGIVGYVDNCGQSTTINRCIYSGTLDVKTNNDNAGGIAGLVGKGCAVTNCLFDGNITVTVNRCGGIVGYSNSGCDESKGIYGRMDGILNCLSYGTVAKKGAYGMITGTNNGYDAKNHKNNYFRRADGNVRPSTDTGSWSYVPVSLSDEVLASSAVYWLGTSDWAKVGSYNYPLPKVKSSFNTPECAHSSYLNGICETCGKQYKEPAIIDAGNYEHLNVSTNYIGYYLITNAGELYWFADKVNAGSNKINAVLYADIDMEGDKHKWKGIGRTALKYSNYEAKDVNFEGKFYGRGHRIFNFYMEGRTQYIGLFNRINSANALVENFTLEGDVHLYGAKSNVGTVAGTVMNSAILQDVSSSVNIHLSPEYPISVVGGVCSSTSAGATINRCRYNGNINANATYDKIGGICGHANGNTTISNCLFDGSITSTSTIDASDKYIRCGGIAAYASDANRTLNIKNCLSQGSISLPNNSCTNDGVGMVFGFGNQMDASKAGITINITNTYYKKDNKSSQAGAIPVVGTSMGDVTVNDASAEVSDAQMSDGTTLTALNTNPADLNWTQGENPVLWPVPLSHKHSFVNGFCQNSGCRSPYEKPAFITEGNYRIQTGGNLFWFAERVNSSGKTYANINATLMNDIDLEGWTDETHTADKHLWVPIGINSAAVDYGCTCAFSGIFDGRGKTIYNLNFKNSSTDNNIYKYIGLFGYVSTGSVKDFTVKGEIYSNIPEKTTAGVIGRVFGNGSAANPTTVEDIISELKITIGETNEAAYLGGVVGLMGGDANNSTYVNINRCTYSGTITSNSKNNFYIGGIASMLRRRQSITNCLFDGKIRIQGTGSNTGTIGGITGLLEATDNLGIKNSLAVGSINGGAIRRPITSLQNTVAGAISSNNYYLQGIADESDSWPTTANVKPVARTSADLALESAAHQLGISNWTHLEGNWSNPRPLVGGGVPRPGVPVLEEDTHQHFTNGFCKLCNRYCQPAVQNAEGQYVIKNAGNLFWFANQVKQGYLTDANVIVLPTDDSGNSTTTIDFEYITDKSSALYGTARHCNTYTPIGGKTYAYAGVFNGNGTKFENFYLNATSDDAGFFGTVYDGTIKNMSVAGNLDINAVYKHIGLIGEIAKGTVEGVTSSLNIKCASGLVAKHIGGVTGSSESCNNTERPVGVVTINRCRFNGTIDAANSIDCLGGVSGYLKNNAIMTNCLFDGSITTLGSGTSCYVGGIFGYINTSDLKVANNLSIGTLSAGSGAYKGAIYGINVNNPKVYTITDNYYNQDNIFPFGHAVNAECDIQAYNISDTQLATNVAVHRLGIANWTMVKTGTEARNYPLPIIEGRYSKLSACTSHTYNANGFCTNCGDYQAPTVVENVYQISNGGQLYAFAQNVNNKTYPQNAKAVLTQNINLEGQNHPWKGIGIKYPTEYAFTGEFDGQGHTINDFYAVATRNYFGLFNYVKGDNAQICNFTINGQLDILSSAKYVSPVIGYYQSLATRVISDITSNVNVTAAPNFIPLYIAGVVAQLDRGSMNRCRYSGTMTANNAYDVLGGIAGQVSNNSTISNCLFDGKILSTSSNGAMSSGGIVSYKSSGYTVTIQNCLSNGTISFPNSDCSSKKIGAVLGYIETGQQAYAIIKNTYYNSDKMKYGSSNTAVPDVCQSNKPTSSKVTFVTVDKLKSIEKKLSVGNWYQVPALGYPIPKLHDHEYFNGICFAAEEDCPVPFEEAVVAKNKYQIKNAGNLFWFAQEWNKGNLATKDAIVVPEDGSDYIDMEFTTSTESSEYGKADHCQTFQPIGNSTYIYNGTFDGNGKTIKNLYVNATGTYSGMFGRISGATIKNMTVEGALNVTANHTRLGLIGNAVNSTISRIHSKFDVNTKSGMTPSYVGGVVGFIESGTSTISNCRYDGNMYLANAKDYLGGIVGYIADNCNISNCLYDGTMVADQNSGDCFIGGILGRSDNSAGLISNCLSVGTITTLNNNRRGAIFGHKTRINSAGQSNILNCYYNHNNIRAIGNVDNCERDIQIYVTNAKMLANGVMAHRLGIENWEMISEYNHPVPRMTNSTGTKCTSHTYSNGFCTTCGEFEPATKVNDYYEITNGGKLYWIAKSINAGTVGAAAKIALKNDIDLEGDSHPWKGIGIQDKGVFFKGIFDGQGHKINNFYAVALHNYFGLINYANDDNVSIKNLTINGMLNIEAPITRVASVVGWYKSKNAITINDVTSNVDINVNLANNRYSTYVGGLIGEINQGSLTRCRYSGTINAGYSYDGLGGICGIATATVTLENCLFDGTIISVSNNNAMRSGGILAYKSGGSAVKIKDCLSNGTLSYANSGCTSKMIGAVLGSIKDDGISAVTITNSYYNNDKMKYSSSNTLVPSECQTNAPSTHAVYVDNNKLVHGTVLSYLGIDDWMQDINLGYPVPHIHSHAYINGFCFASLLDHCDAKYEEATVKSGVYQIANGGNMYWFANKVNSTPKSTYNAVLTADIDLEGKYANGTDKRMWTPIATINNDDGAYKGNFDGQGHKITNLNYRNSDNKIHSGVFGVVGTGSMKNFSISGDITVPSTFSENLYLGIIGRIRGNNYVIENITSSLNFNIEKTSTIKGNYWLGGIVGLFESGKTVTINQCRFNGKINSKHSAISAGIGGILGLGRGLATIKNCLYDGTIESSATSYNILVGGIVGKTVDDNGGFSGAFNCLSVGEIKAGTNVVRAAITNYVGNNATGTNNKCRYNYYASATGLPFDGQRTSWYAAATPIAKTDALLNSGEVCALLNTGINASKAVWGQILGNDPANTEAMEYPIPGNSNHVTADANKNYTAEKYILHDCGPAAVVPSDANGGTVMAKSMTYNRPFSDTKWQTWFAPFQMSASEWTENYDIAKITNYHERFIDKNDKVHENVLEAQLVTSGKILPNHPYLVRAKNTASEMTFTNANISASAEKYIECASTRNEFKFQGVIASTPINGSNLYVLGDWDETATNGDDALEAKTSATIPAMRWYMQKTVNNQYGNSSASSARRIFIHLEGTDDYDDWDLTDIDEITTDGVYPIAYYTTDGVGHKTPQEGKLNIIKMSDGSVKKVFINNVIY